MTDRFRLRIDPDLRTVVPGYVGAVLYASGLENSESDERSDALLRQAEVAVGKLPDGPAAHPHMVAWAEVYRALGSNPDKYKNGCLALSQRAPAPRINALVDVYNAISMLHMLPLGGEDWDTLAGELILKRASGGEAFDPGGGRRVESVPAGEAVWVDVAGVTTRRFNWRQCRRTQITPATRAAYFVFDVVPPFSQREVEAAADELTQHLKARCPAAELSLAYL